ncbi:MAG: Uncharacterized protein Greene101415_960 [Parcubacteria group bacterium Greene1014_15]|nr:MAG: Uncharacterized protein Greene101415_960 [Parcubacteria group bacterium Greene1014_15]
MVLQKNRRFTGLFGKKTIAAILAVSFIVPPLLLLKPNKADAIVALPFTVPVSDILNAPTHLFHTKQTFLNVSGKEFGFDGILWLIAKQLIQTLVSDLVSWINSGFNGAPAFVTDFQGFMLEVADRTLGAFLEGTSLAFLCDPFKVNIRLALQLRFRPFSDRVSCRLSDAIANLNSFLSGDFLEGGFPGLMRVTMIPHHNMYGAFLMAEDALLLSMTRNLHEQQKKLEFGRGFLSFDKKSCATPEEDDPHCTTVTKTPGAVIESQLETALGSGIRQLELADEFDEIIGALMSQLVNQVLQGGLFTLGSNNSPGGNLSFIGRLRDDRIPQSTVTPTAESVGFVPPPPGTLPPGGPTDPNAFSYTLTSPGRVSVMPGGIATLQVTKTLQSGTAQSVSLTVPTSPSIVTNHSFGNDPCNPSCTSIINFTVSPTAAVGFYNATISGSPAPSNANDINVIIEVTNTPPPPDTTPPTLTFGSPTPVGNGVGLIVPITFSDDVAIDHATLTFVNTGVTQTTTGSPFSFQFDVSTFSDGIPLNFTATAFDTSGNQTIVTKTTFLFGDTPQ